MAEIFESAKVKLDRARDEVRAAEAMMKEADGKWPEIEIDHKASTVISPSKKWKKGQNKGAASSSMERIAVAGVATTGGTIAAATAGRSSQGNFAINRAFSSTGQSSHRSQSSASVGQQQRTGDNDNFLMDFNNMQSASSGAGQGDNYACDGDSDEGSNDDNTGKRKSGRGDGDSDERSNDDDTGKRKSGRGDGDSDEGSNDDDTVASKKQFDDKALRKKYRVHNGESGKVWSETLETAMDTKIVSRNDNRTFSKLLPLSSLRDNRDESKVVGFASKGFHVPTDDDDLFPGYIAGNVVLPPRGIKDAEGVGLCSQVFKYVMCYVLCLLLTSIVLTF